jgi:uncharacterized delta-60 repeat protein
MDLSTWFRRSAALLITAAFACSVHAAQDGPYDPNFGTGGRAWIKVTADGPDDGSSLIRLPNGNFFMAGTCGLNSCGAWLTPSGAFASGYGISGTGKAAFVGYPGWPLSETGMNGAAAFTDGRIVLALDNDNSSDSYVAILRADGTGMDTAVGNGAGYIAPTFQTLLVRVTPQQQVIVAGQTASTPIALIVARYDATMHLDTNFGTGGSTSIGFSDGDFVASAMTLQNDGKIVVIGTVDASQHKIGIIRLTAGGIPDPGFGVNSDGRFESAFGNAYDGVFGSDVAVDKQGRLVIVGGSFLSGLLESQWFVDRLLGGGAVDAGFHGGQPQVFTPFSSSTAHLPQACCVGVQSDGRIVVVGTFDRAVTYTKYFSTSRFTDAGEFDSSYGIGGQSYGDMSPQPDSEDDLPRAMVIVPGGIVIGGSTTIVGGEKHFSATKVSIDPLFASGFE